MKSGAPYAEAGRANFNSLLRSGFIRDPYGWSIPRGARWLIRCHSLSGVSRAVCRFAPAVIKSSSAAFYSQQYCCYLFSIDEKKPHMAAFRYLLLLQEQSCRFLVDIAQKRCYYLGA